MSGFTVAYLARLGALGLVATLIEGALLLAAWRGWRALARGASPALRCRVASLHFAGLAVLPALSVVVLHATALEAGMDRPAAQAVGLAQPASGAVAWLLTGLAAVWILGVAAMALKLGREAGRLARLTRAPAPEALTALVRRLSDGREIETRVAAVTAPQVVGAWRPVLLTPPGFLEALPPEQAEAVLRHELAHVRRGDFGWNLAQRLLLAVLWFQPAAWSLYGEIRRAREAACDAMAVRQGASPTELARALVGLAEAGPALAMAAAARGGLSARVNELLCPPSRARRRRLVLAAGLPLICLAALPGARLGLLDHTLGELRRASAFGPTLEIAARDPVGPFSLKVREGRVIAASIDGRPAAIDQRGQQVVLRAGAAGADLSLRVAPAGRVSWEARRPAD